MKVILASDHGGVNLRKEVADVLNELEVKFEDIGCDCEGSVDYPDYAIPAAERVANGEFDKAILICGTGIGMSHNQNICIAQGGLLWLSELQNKAVGFSANRRIEDIHIVIIIAIVKDITFPNKIE